MPFSNFTRNLIKIFVVAGLEKNMQFLILFCLQDQKGRIQQETKWRSILANFT